MIQDRTPQLRSFILGMALLNFHNYFDPKYVVKNMQKIRAKIDKSKQESASEMIVEDMMERFNISDIKLINRLKAISQFALSDKSISFPNNKYFIKIFNNTNVPLKDNVPAPGYDLVWRIRKVLDVLDNPDKEYQKPFDNLEVAMICRDVTRRVYNEKHDYVELCVKNMKAAKPTFNNDEYNFIMLIFGVTNFVPLRDLFDVPITVLPPIATVV